MRQTSAQSLAELAESIGGKEPNLTAWWTPSRNQRKLVPRVRYQRAAILMELECCSTRGSTSHPFAKRGRQEWGTHGGGVMRI